MRSNSGQPQVRWGRVVLFVLAFLGMQIVSMGVVSWYAEVPLRPAIVVLMVCGVLAYLVVVIEQQRQKILSGRWRFRLSLQVCLLLMLIACVFFGTLGNLLRTTQRDHAENLRLKTALEQSLGGVKAYIGTAAGGRITCQATRADFNDDDLAQLVELSSQRGRGRCELSGLFLEPTSITDAGVQQLAICQELRILALPAIPLSDASLAAIAKCTKLEHLLLNEKPLAPDQLAMLRKALPNTRLNGKTWEERGP